MLRLEDGLIKYEFNSCVTFANGHKSSFRKVEHIQVVKSDDGYSFTMLGPSDATIDGNEPEEWNAIILQFGKALYPYNLLVSENGEMIGVQDFEKIKDHWFEQRRGIIDYYNSYLVEKESNRFYLAFNSEEKFFNIIKNNMFPRLLFWQDNLKNQEVEIRDFPAAKRLAIFTFGEGKKNNGEICHETYNVRDEGSGRLLSGECTLRIRRDADGLPGNVFLKVQVEELNTGYFFKEMTLKRL